MEKSEKNQEKGIYKSLAVNFGLVLLTDLVVSLIILLVWNTAGLWLVPSFPKMSLLVAVGLGTVFVFGELLVKYWIDRWIQIRRVKALTELGEIQKELEIVNLVVYDLALLKEQLKTKGII